MATTDLDASQHHARIYELDLLKTLALILMVIYHFVFDLNAFADVPIDYHAPLWHTVQRTSASLFIFVAGVTSGLSRHPVRQGLRIFAYGLMITVVTYIFLPEEYVRFGILHFLGTATLILFFLRRQKTFVLIILAILSAIIGFTLKDLYLETPLLLPLGVKYLEFSSIDYFPIFPYLSISFIGLITYRLLYMKTPSNQRGFLRPRRLPKLLSHSSAFSSHSLLIYLTHQLFLLGIIFAFLALTR